MAPMTPTPFNINQANQAAMAMKDEDFIPNTWADLKFAIEAKDNSTLSRAPSMIRAYVAWSQRTTAEYGSLGRFLLSKRLRWDAPDKSCQAPRSNLQLKNPLSDRSNYRILYNDWPYGFTPDITHLVVWLKTPLPICKESQEMTPDAKALVRIFVENTFVWRMKDAGVGVDNVLYFKNVPEFQSVGVLEHFHVLLRGAKKELLDEWTGGDIPMYMML